MPGPLDAKPCSKEALCILTWLSSPSLRRWQKLTWRLDLRGLPSPSTHRPSGKYTRTDEIVLLLSLWIAQQWHTDKPLVTRAGGMGISSSWAVLSALAWFWTTEVLQGWLLCVWWEREPSTLRCVAAYPGSQLAVQTPFSDLTVFPCLSHKGNKHRTSWAIR